MYSNYFNLVSCLSHVINMKARMIENSFHELSQARTDTGKILVNEIISSKRTEVKENEILVNKFCR